MKCIFRVLISIFLYFLLLCPSIDAKILVTEGVAFIGSGITLEEAELIALNDARQKALNSLGVFVESESIVVNYRLTHDEIRTIAGAIITSEILESRKEVFQDSFVLKIKAKFNISEPSFQQALDNYRDRGGDQKTIKNLMETIQRLQAELAAHQESTPEKVELVDEIAFSSNRLSKLLTTRQVIDHELEMQNLYKSKTKTHFANNVFPKLYAEIANLLKWETIPEIRKTMPDPPEMGRRDQLCLKYLWPGSHINDAELFKNINGAEHFKNQLVKYVKALEPIAKEYDQLNLKVRPIFRYNISFPIPVYVYVNGNKTTRYFACQLIRIGISVFLRIYDAEEKFRRLYTLTIGSLGDVTSPSSSWDIYLPWSYTLSDIENIEIRVGRISRETIEYSFFQKEYLGL